MKMTEWIKFYLSKLGMMVYLFYLYILLVGFDTLRMLKNGFLVYLEPLKYSYDRMKYYRTQSDYFKQLEEEIEKEIKDHE